QAEEDDPLIQAVGTGQEPLAWPVAEQRFPRWKKVFLGRQDGAVIVEARFRPSGQSFENVFAVLFDGRMKLAKLLNDGGKEIQLLFAKPENLHGSLLGFRSFSI